MTDRPLSEAQEMVLVELGHRYDDYLTLEGREEWWVFPRQMLRPLLALSRRDLAEIQTTEHGQEARITRAGLLMLASMGD